MKTSLFFYKIHLKKSQKKLVVNESTKVAFYVVEHDSNKGKPIKTVLND